MGGFLSALGSAISGAGAASVPYNERLLQQWRSQQADLTQMLDHALSQAQTPQALSDVTALRAKVSKLKPGQDPSKLLNEVQLLFQVHPNAEKLLTPPKALEPNAGAVRPGATPGSLAPLITGAPTAVSWDLPDVGVTSQPKAAVAGGTLPVNQTPARTAPVQPMAAQPGTNPIQGGAQIQIPPVQVPGEEQSPTVASGMVSALEDIYAPYRVNGLIPPGAERMLAPIVQAQLANAAKGERLYEVGGALVNGQGQVVYQAPQPAGKPINVAPGGVLWDPNTGQPVFSAPTKPDQVKWELHTATDDKGVVREWFTNPVTKESTAPVEKGKIGKEKQSTPIGTLIPVVNNSGEITGLLNNKTGALQTPPVAGARKSPLSATENTRRGAMNGMLKQATMADRLSTKYAQYIGPVAGRATEFKLSTVGYDNPDIAELVRLSNDLSDQLLRARSGAQINEQEYKRLSKLVPRVTQPFSTYRSNLASFTRSLNELALTTTGGQLGNPEESGIIHPLQGEGAGAPIVQRSKSTGKYRYSTDGGKTWRAGQPPK